MGGTEISVSRTATGFWERRITYDWTLTKSVTPDHVTIRPGASSSVDYTLTATRTLASDVMVYGARGQICVTNHGTIATEGLVVTDQVQAHVAGGPFYDIAGASESIPIAVQIPGGETRCYEYEVTLTPVTGATYRNLAFVTITNHTGHLGEAFGPGSANGLPTAFTIPAAYTPVIEDAEADISDVPSCPTGITCSPSHGPWHETDSATITYSTTLEVASTVACNTNLTVDNTATLTESTSGQTHTASASVYVYTDACAQGCTPGYWKNHLRSWSGFSWLATVGSVFPPSADYGLDGFTLRQGLAFRGGSTNEGAAEILLRAGISALLNAAHPDVAYAIELSDVIERVNAALASNDRATMLTLATELDLDNNAFCPLN